MIPELACCNCDTTDARQWHNLHDGRWVCWGCWNPFNESLP